MTGQCAPRAHIITHPTPPKNRSCGPAATRRRRRTCCSRCSPTAACCCGAHAVCAVYVLSCCAVVCAFACVRGRSHTLHNDDVPRTQTACSRKTSTGSRPPPASTPSSSSPRTVALTVSFVAFFGSQNTHPSRRPPVKYALINTRKKHPPPSRALQRVRRRAPPRGLRRRRATAAPARMSCEAAPCG